MTAPGISDHRRTRSRKAVGLVGILAMFAALAATAPNASGDIRSDERELLLSQDTTIDGAGIAGGAEPNDAFGRALAFGDFNDDDYMDVVVGVTGEDTGAGAINIIYGGENGLRADNDTIITQDTAGVDCCAEEAGDALGWSLAVGHFNNDTYADLAVGVPFENQGATVDTGLVHIFYGGAGGLSTANDIHFAQGDNGFPGAIEAGDYVGRALAAGDYNGDGRDDLAVGIPGESVNTTEDAGFVVVLFGQPAGLSSAGFLNIPDPSFGGPEASDQFGSALASGDFDADGIDDLAVGAPSEDRDGINSGAVTIFGGVAGVGPVESGAFSLSDFGVTPDSGDAFGGSLTTGDFNGDGNDDLAIGAPGADSPAQVNGGVVSILHGDATDGLTIERSQVISAATPGAPSVPNGTTGFGRVLGVGEFDGDGRDDLVVTFDAARTAVFPGGPDGVGTSGSHIIGQRGHSIGAGDVDNDGVDDLGIGNINASVGNDANAGHVFFRYGTMTPTCRGALVTVDLARGDVPTDGDDVILGTDEADEIDALGGDDIICALDGDDEVVAGSGDDQVDAGPGDDDVRGGSGDDTIWGRGGADIIRGNGGVDTIRGGSGDDDIRGGKRGDLLIGGNGEDTIRGNSGHDVIRGSKKADVLLGGKGDDTLRGNSGADRLDGGPGNDTCVGGTGADTLISC